MQEQTNSLKRGDKVLTTSGIYGTIVDLQLDEDRKIVTIETGTDKKKGFVSIDAYAIYKVFTEEQNQENKDSTLKSDVSQPKDESNIQKKVIVDEEKLKSTTKTLESDSSNDKVEAEKEIKKNEDNR